MARASDPAAAPAAPSRLYYGWVVVGVVLLTFLFALGLRYAYGVFYVAILADTGWTRADTAGIFSLAMLVYAGTSVLSGALFDWLGPRVLFPLGAVILGVGLILCSRIDSIAELYTYYGVLVGVGYSFLGFIPHMALVSRWFVRRRGLATAVALSGIGIGSLVMSVLSEALIVRVGWRETFFFFGIAAMVLLIPVTAAFHRDRPERLGLHPDGAAEPPGPPGPGAQHGISWWRAMGHPAFWALFFTVFFLGMNTMAFAVHQTRLSVDLGFGLALSATLFGLTGLFRSVGGMIWGPLSDRIGRRPCIAFAVLMGVAAIALLHMARADAQVWMLVGFVALWGLGVNGLPPLYASAVADRFHGPHIGKIYGLLDLGFGTGSAFGPWAAGWIFDRAGHYGPALWAMMGTTALVGIALWSASPRRLSAA